MAHSYPSTAYQEFTYFPKWEMPSMRIKYSFQIGGFGKEYFYYSLLQREECTILLSPSEGGILFPQRLISDMFLCRLVPTLPYLGVRR